MTIYCAANWPECDKIRLILKNNYDTWNLNDKIIEVVIISMDKNIDAFN